MPRSSPSSKSSQTPIRVIGAAVAVGLHAAILAAIVSAPPQKIEMELPETVEIHFVELSDEVEDAAPNENEADTPGLPEPVEAVAEADPTPEPEPIPEPEPTPEPEPIAEPEPLPEPEPAPEPEPIPEPLPEPEPEPDPEPEPEPEAITEPPPPPAPEPPPPPKPEPPPPPKREPPPKPKPTPEPPKPRPAPKPQPAKPQPKPAPATAQQAPAGTPPSGKETAAVPKAPSAPVDPDRPRMVSSVDYMGRRPTPEYPRMSQRRGEQGRVIVRVLISPEGTVIDAQIQRSSGHERLDAAALKAVRSARFKPYKENGHAYRALADIPFDFVL